MYGYKSIKWLDRIEVVNEVIPGYWENYGYAVNGWIGGSQ
jgi:DMSO/TMAO reductase YedYZ molybdopterin-dependent catalytic subunit